MELSSNKKNNKKWVYVVIIFSISLYSFIKRDFTKQKNSAINNLLIGLVAPLQEGVGRGHNFFSNLWNIYLLNIDASRQNKELKKKVSELKEEIFYYFELKKENIRLRSILKYENSDNFINIVAEISGRDAGASFKTLRINKGMTSGVKVESPVYTPEGLVGFVYQVYKNYSDVMTILDSNSRVEVLSDRTRSHGILEGISGNTCLIKYVDQDEDINLNDILVTSGLGNIYPKGIKVGRIIKIEKESFGITQELILLPSVNFNSLEEVIIGVKRAK